MVEENTDTANGDHEAEVHRSSRTVNKSRRSRLDEPVAPDGGWGWVILFASFLSAVIVDGVCFSFGIFYLEFLDYYEGNKGKTAWVGSVLNGTYMIMGPIAAALAKRFGCRPVAIVGSIWSAIAFVLGTFSPNINWLILTYGVLGGMGFGLIYLPSIVIVQYYFDKKRAFATGVATCGSGIGAILFAQLSNWLIGLYAWKGAQWIIGAVVLNGVVLGCVYRPLTFRELERIRRRWQRTHEQQERLKLEVEIHNSNLRMHALNNVDACSNGLHSTDKLGPNMRAHPTPGLIVPDDIRYIDSVMSFNSRGYFGSTNSAFSHDYNSDGIRRRKNLLELKKGDIAASMGSLSILAAHDNNMDMHIHDENIDLHVGDNATDISDDTDHGDDKMADVFKDLFRGIKETMDFSMLTCPVFCIYGISCIFSMAGFFVPFTYLPDRAISLGYGSSSGAVLLSVLGLSNTFGRILAGWASDRPWADCLVINNIALIIGGVATIFCPYIESYWLLVMYALVFGTCIAAFVTLRSIILVDLIGLDKLASAFGLVVLCQGISSFVGSPLAGSLYDMTGTYNWSFHVAGTFIALSGVVCVPLRRIAAWEKYRRRARMLKELGLEDELLTTTANL